MYVSYEALFLVYRIFTSLFVDRLSLGFVISLIMFTVSASRVENQDGLTCLFLLF